MNASAMVKGKTLVITLPLESDPQLSASGKNLLVASTRGVVETEAKIDGKKIKVAVNAMIKP
jgi:hypothetical protein